MRKILIWGCTVSYNKLISRLQAYDVEIQALISKDNNSFKLDGYKIIKPESIPEFEYEYIIVASNAFKEIKNFVETSELLNREGCTIDKLIPYYVFENPGFDFEKYIRFKNNRPSILSNFCLGGHLYKQWGLPFLSPTINMYALGENYLEFLKNYLFYLSKPMEKYENESYIEGTVGREAYTPKGIIDNKIIWYLNHDVFPELAINKWNTRRSRVNSKNIYALMTIYTDEQAYEFEALDIKKKIGFYHKNLGLKSVIYLKEWEDMEVRNKYTYSFAMLVNALAYQQDMCNIDWLSFFSGEDRNIYLRKCYEAE